MKDAKLKKLNFKMQYDPDDVDIRLEHFSIEDIIKLIEDNKLEIIEENERLQCMQCLGNQSAACKGHGNYERLFMVGRTCSWGV